MSVAEMLGHVQHFLQKPFSKCHSHEPDYPERDGAPWLTVPEGINPEPYIHCADELLGGRITMFGVELLELGHPPVWNQAIDYPGPDNGGYSLQQGVRFARLAEDIKMVWEPSRHHHLVTLAQAYCLSGEQKYLDGLLLQLESWLDECPYPSVPHWKSPLEAGIRLINWSAAWQLLGGKDAAVFSTDKGNVLLQRWLLSINQHCCFIDRNISVYSSANNHLIGEAAGLFVASVSWPIWTDSLIWRERAQSILIDEIVKQTYPDGSGKEQAFSYLQFVLDFFWISGLAGKANGIQFPSSCWERIEAMLLFIASVMDVRGNMPMVGDADDGNVVVLSREKGFCPFRSQLATGGVWFQRQEFLTKAGRMDDKTRWLLGDYCKEVHLQAEENPTWSLQRHFPDGGYHILGSGFETESEVRLLVDTGQLGYLSIAAHGHADALSVVLSIGGREFLVDPGTFAYNSDPAWRHYFRGTSAHNTVIVDGLDQSEYCGSFMWRRHAVADCFYADETFVSAAHNGYSRLPDPVIHQRDVIYDSIAREFRIVDIMICRRKHHIQQHWHFSDCCEVQKTADGFLVSNDNYGLCLITDSVLTKVELVRGDEVRPAGWVSREFGVRRPSTTIICSADITGKSSFETRIMCDDPPLSS